ncbi:MAG TPA: FprA family A-type flavoprotein [Anaerolineae bacterium]|nr:FprA family A-type flavoprotein [Anaerolineae bacterium]
MKTYNSPEIARGVYWVGARDWNRRLFDALIPLPQGTTYNAYLVKGEDKTALIDTVNPGFEKELEGRISQLMDPQGLDYLIMNHAEPDHAGAIPHIMALSASAKLVTTQKGSKMAQVYYGVPEERITVVKEGDTIDLGGKTLRFIDAPWQHWPETMFTYLVENKVLFPCDFLGFHTASGFYDDEVEEFVPFAQRYFGEIMMPFRKMGQQALEKISKLDIELIGPSHGPMHRNPQRILDLYRRWTAGETKEKVIVVYVTMWKSTESMIEAMVEALMGEGLEVELHNLTTADLGDVARDLVDSRAIVLGTPAVLGGMHPLAIYAAHLVKALRPPLKYGAVLSSYGWGGGAVKQAAEILEPTKIEVVGAVEVNGPPTADDYQKIAELGRQLAAKVKGQA